LLVHDVVDEAEETVEEPHVLGGAAAQEHVCEVEGRAVLCK
jgi:hypothetical protein